MPFDGVVTKCVAGELSDAIAGGRVEKIFQPETDEIIIGIRAKGCNQKLLLSANPNYPRIHLTGILKENPAVPPVFCMLLRKHLSGGKILSVEFADFERIITLKIESTNELGDLSVKNLIIEIMGRHSNIILTNSEDKILDAIKHVDSDISRVREIMPARPYSLPPPQDKTSPEALETEGFFSVRGRDEKQGLGKYILSTVKGFSPLLCSEVCLRSGIDEKTPVSEITPETAASLEKTLSDVICGIRKNEFFPCLIPGESADDKPVDFHCIRLCQWENIRYFPSISEVLDTYYSTRDNAERLKQKKSDVYKVLNNNLDRCNKKLAMHEQKLRDVSNREKLQLYGELITANIYCIPKNAKSVSLQNYYSESEEYLDIAMDETLTPQQNAQRYFKQYSKAKNTFMYVSRQLEEAQSELEYLESVLTLLENCKSLKEIDEVRDELIEQGYCSSKKKKNKKAKRPLPDSKPFRFKSSDGIDILVGKNNKQNDLLTLKLAASNDIWLHTRNIPGSHVIIRRLGRDIPDKTLLEAAVLASYHSRAKNSSSVPVDYTSVKNVKKPSGAKPGMVIYDNFKTVVATPDEQLAQRLKVE
ncbi:putative ribosome quality control (RQC) complex YloA/Tae2 family protein [Anaerobacterium chartisolvens]|uniref:Rqc2 homolog RqcH n=1 Tax=Anaerobacterium chartisolvens TaxID=1297424 RepID=A0A369ALZ8_9FIRM|nr:NFACT RNA binding domain-containing protein [Anaerobacterium chartisolvens]RCX09306.1 putative ribosome quality control (RQC) complex YloA/Tae2 family protein [Anaerobacterium chartisolvens]